MSLARPSAVVTLDGQKLSSAEGAVVWLRATLSVEGAHDAVEFRVWTPSKFTGAAPGATLTVALGDAGSEDDVFTGKVTSARTGPGGISYEGLAATRVLSETFTSKSYINQSVADIVNDLASAVDIDTVDASLALAVWHVDNTRPVWTHLQTLARLTGSDLGAAADGSLRFVPADADASPVKLRYGAELLDWDIAQAPAPAVPAVVAHGAGSESGSSRWHWLRHDPASDPSRSIGGIATTDAADEASKALAGRAARAAVRGRLLIVGNASIRPGDGVELSDLPVGDPGALHVTGVQHTLDSVSGFLTRLTVEGAGGSGGFGL